MALLPDQRGALRVLAGSPLGSTQSIMMAHGFGIETLNVLLRNGLATSERRSVRAGERMIMVTRLAITDAGRRAIRLT
jgi:hypothetical protein